MAKIKIIYLYILCVFICSSLTGQGFVIQTKNEEEIYTEYEKRQCIKELYDSQIGVREYGGANRGASVEMYLASVDLGPGYAWCAAFVSWCYQNENIMAPHSGWVPSYALKSKRVYQRGTPEIQTPQTGDVFMIWYRNLNRAGHIGFVDTWGDKWVITVEGNTNDNGSREGDGVYRKRRLKNQIWVVSDFVRSR